LGCEEQILRPCRHGDGQRNRENAKYLEEHGERLRDSDAAKLFPFSCPSLTKSSSKYRIPAFASLKRRSAGSRPQLLAQRHDQRHCEGGTSSDVISPASSDTNVIANKPKSTWALLAKALR